MKCNATIASQFVVLISNHKKRSCCRRCCRRCRSSRTTGAQEFVLVHLAPAVPKAAALGQAIQTCLQ